MRIRRAGVSEQPAFHEDYAFMVQGLASLYRTTGEREWLDAAVDLADRARTLFWDPDAGGYYFAVETPSLIARSKSSRDGAIPSGNSAMAHALLDLAELTGDERWRRRAEETITAFSGVVGNAPSGHLYMVHAIERLLAQRDRNTGASGRVDLPSLADADHASEPLDSDKYVELSADLARTEVRPGESFTVRMTLDIAPGWHVNANPASAKNLIATTVDVRSELPIEVERIEYPDPESIQTGYAGSAIDVYDGEAEIRAVCRLNDTVDGGTDTGTIRALVVFQACDDRSCLAPSEQIREMDLGVIH